MNKRLEKIRARTPAHVKRYVRQSMDIADQIQAILEEQGKSQKDLAKALGKTESEISKWLSGSHNLTIKSISKIEAALGTDILMTPIRVNQVINSHESRNRGGYSRSVEFTSASGITVTYHKKLDSLGPSSKQKRNLHKGRFIRVA